MGETPHPAVPALPGLTIEAVEWLPSGADSGLLRVRGRWEAEVRERELPWLVLAAERRAHRFESLPDARFSRDPSHWRGTYLVPAALVATDPEALWVEWADGVRAGLPALARGAELGISSPGGELIDRSVLAERRARRAEMSEQQQARVAAEAMQAVEALEQRSAQLEQRLEEAVAERDALADRLAAPDPRNEALAAALASAAELRAHSREWRQRLRADEVAHASNAVQLAVLRADPVVLEEREAELAELRRVAEAQAAELAAAREAATAARADADAAAGRFEEARSAWDGRREHLQAELARVSSDLAAAREDAGLASREREDVQRRLAEAEAQVTADHAHIASLETALRAAESRLSAAETAAATAEARLRVESVARTALEDELDRERALAADALARAQQEAETARAELAAAGTSGPELEQARADLATAEERLTAAQAQLVLFEEQLTTARAESEALRAELDSTRGELDAARADRDSTRAELASARVEADAARADAETARTEADAARSELATARTDADAVRGELATTRADADAARAELAAARDEAAAAGANAEAARGAHEQAARARAEADAARDQVASLGAELAGARSAAETARADAAAARAELEALGAEVEALRPQLDSGGAGEVERLRADLESMRVDVDAARSEAGEARGALESARAEVEGLREQLTAAQRDLQAAGEARGSLDATIAELRDQLAQATPPSEAASLQARIAELERRPGAADLERLAREQEDAASGWEPPTEAQSLAASLDAAAATLRARAPAPPPPADASPGADAAADGADESNVAAADAGEAAAAPAAPVGPKIVSARNQPPRADAVGRSRRDYPLLRGALVKLAHDDPVAAGRVLAALLPAQALAVNDALSYDLTIHGVGAFAVTTTGTTAEVAALERPRPRGQADFHLKADPLTLAELLAGVHHRIGRFSGRARISGRKRRAKALKAVVSGAPSLTDAARAGVRLEPALAWRMLAYAVHPTWTRGHAFTIAQTIAGEPPETFYLTARDGFGLAVTTVEPGRAPTATVTMSRASFDLLLEDEPAPRGQRPQIRGDREAVAALYAWIERARRG